MIIDTTNESPVEWQGRAAGKGRWTRIDPPKHETMEERVAYLLARQKPDGSRMYEVRALYAVQIAATGAPT